MKRDDEYNMKDYRKITGEEELPPKGSFDRRLLENYGIEEYAKILRDRKANPRDEDGDENFIGL